MSSKLNKYNITIPTLGIYDTIKSALSNILLLELQFHIILIEAC